MKKVATLLAFSTVLAYGSVARAADLPEAPAVYDWTGFYLGGNIGYGFGGDDKVGLDSNLGTAADINDIDKLQLSGIFGGGQIGYDWQAGSFVIGSVADIEASGVKDSFSDNFSFKGADLTVDAKDNIDVWGTVRGKLGWAFDRILIYGTGGLAWADINYKTKGLNHDTGFTFSGSDNGVRAGWTAGGGLAWAIDDQWSIGAEYL